MDFVRMISNAKGKNNILKGFLVLIVAPLLILSQPIRALAQEGNKPLSEGKGAGIKVIVKKLGIKKATYKTGFSTPQTKIEYLHIYVSILNDTDSSLFHYDPPFKTLKSKGGLTDNFGNKYNPATQTIYRLEERPSRKVPIYPGKSLDDVFIFELPVQKTKHLVLNIPLEVIEEDGFITITFPYIRPKKQKTQKEKKGMRKQEETRKYVASNLMLENVRVALGEYGGLAIFGTVVNKGDKILNEVELRVYFLNAEGKRIGEHKYYPVLVTKYSSSDDYPLKPGYRKDFGFRLADYAPSGWSKEIETSIIDIEFAKEREEEEKALPIVKASPPKSKETPKPSSQEIPQPRKLPLRSGADLERYARQYRQAEESAVVSLDTRDFRYISYFATIKKQIESDWRYPEEAAKKGVYGELKLRFTVLRNGSVKEVQLIRSSGSSVLDEAAIRTVKAASPFNPFPKRIKRNRLLINAVFSYKPSQSELR